MNKREIMMTAWIRVRLMKAKGWTGSTHLMLSIALKDVYKLMKNEVVCADCKDCISKNNCKYQSAILADDICMMKQPTSLYADDTEYININELNEVKCICDDESVLLAGKRARAFIIAHLNAIYRANKTLNFKQSKRYIKYHGDNFTEKFGLNFKLTLSAGVYEELHKAYDDEDDVYISDELEMSRYRYEKYKIFSQMLTNKWDELKQGVISTLNSFSAETYQHMLELYDYDINIEYDTDDIYTDKCIFKKCDIDALIELGARRWTSGSKDRLYIQNALEKLLNVRYNKKYKHIGADTYAYVLDYELTQRQYRGFLDGMQHSYIDLKTGKQFGSSCDDDLNRALIEAVDKYRTNY